jgi:hypothetical protein
MRYSEFVERVASFRASSVTDTCAYILWDQFGQRFSAAENQDIALLRAFGGRIAVIAATHGEESTPKLARGGDLFRLSHEFLEVDDGALEEAFQAEERRKLFECWTRSSVLGEYRLTDRCLAEATLARTVMRMMRSQWDLTNAHSHALPRAWELIRRVQRRTPTLDPIGYLKRALAMEPQAFLRTAYLLFAMNARDHGRLDFRGAQLSDKFPESWDIRNDDLLLVAERMSIHADDLRRWEHEVVTPLPDAFRKYAPLPLPRFPLIQRREQVAAPAALRGRYVTPCPGSAQLALQNACVQLLREAPPAGSKSHAVELGHALEGYLYDFLVTVAGRENVLRVDSIARDTRRADMIVAVGSKAFVIESKSLLGSSTAKAIAEAHDSVEIWEKIHGAYEQCACTVRDDALWRASPRLSSVTDVASLVCFDEVLCIEGTAFNALSACAGISERLGVNRIETVTVQYLESVISWYGLERLFDLITEKWASGKQGDDLTAFIANKKQGPSRKQGRTPPHLAPAFNELFPGLPEP